MQSFQKLVGGWKTVGTERGRREGEIVCYLWGNCRQTFKLKFKQELPPPPYLRMLLYLKIRVIKLT